LYIRPGIGAQADLRRLSDIRFSANEMLGF
jgi:hypothetical protein